MDIEIQRLRDPDHEAAIDLWVRARWGSQPWLEERMGYTPEQDQSHFRDHICVRFQTWVARDGSVVLGWMALSEGQVEYLYVDPDFQRSGVGSALLGKARQLNPDQLTLYTHQKNERACRFYEKHGFIPVEYGMSPPPENEPDVLYKWHRHDPPTPAPSPE